MIVTDNLFGDILTDLGGAVSGGIGRAASANLNPARTGPSLFEPVHGSAPDIAGTGKANPRAAILSAAMMLEFLGEADAAARIHKAVAKSDDVTRLDRRDRRRHRRKGLSHAHHPDREDLDGRRARRLGRRHASTCSPTRLHYGSGVFEGIRAYATADGPAVFRLTDHIERLFNSRQDLHDRHPVHASTSSSRRRKDTVRVNGLPTPATSARSSYLGYGEMGLNPLPCPVNVSIAAWPWGTYLGDEGLEARRADEDRLVAAPRPQRRCRRRPRAPACTSTRRWPRSRR